MQYLGGKFRIGASLVRAIAPSYHGETWFEPSCGGLNLTLHAANTLAITNMVLADVCPELIALYQALYEGWVPPDTVSEEEYQRLRYANCSALKGFAAFGCSFGGKRFGGYARGRNSQGSQRNYAAESQRNLLKTFKVLRQISVTFLHGRYEDHDPHRQCIYVDPPYAGKTAYASGDLDVKNFWDTMRRYSETNTVFISEYVAPEDFKVVWETAHRLSVRSTLGCEVRTERLFRLRT